MGSGDRQRDPRRTTTAGEASAASPAVGSPSQELLSLERVWKRFGAVQALRDVTVTCSTGQIHAVVGENGSGKSTLLSIASGVLAPDDGTVRIGGTELGAADADTAHRLGLAMAYQTYSQVLELTVAENLALAAPAGDRPSHADMEAWAAKKLAAFSVDVQPSARTGSLSLAQRQFLEVVKALLSGPRVLLLDEPTTALAPTEVDRLHELVVGLAAEGVGVVYVSHRLPEVLGFAHQVTVLRDGESQGTFDASTVSESDLVALMVGRPLQLAFPPRRDTGPREPSLVVSGLGSRRFGPVDLTLAQGEVVGLAGADGNGQERFLRSLAGIDGARGSVTLDGRPVALRSPAAALAAGIMFLSGERVRESLFPVLGVRANSSIQVLRRFSRWGWVRRVAERTEIAKLAELLKVRAPSVEQPVRFLSGGNQQKVVMMRPFLKPLRVLLADEPTQGVDVRSRFDIYEALREKADEGVSMIIRSSDPIELAGMCDRVLVFSRGRVVDEIAQVDLSEHRIVESIVGAPRPGAAPVDQPTEPVTRPAVPPRPGRIVGSWVPLALMALLLVGIGAYTASESSAFLTEFNLYSLLLTALPLAFVAMGQVNPLLVGGFDISVGALMTLVICVASTVLSSSSVGALIGGSLALLGIGIASGALNAFLIRKLAMPSIIATLATLSVMQGIALLLRPVPGGSMDIGFMNAMTSKVAFLPIGFIAAAALAIALDFALYRTRWGLSFRAVGFDALSSRRVGLRVGRTHVLAFVLSGVFAVAAAFFLAGQVGVGDANVGSSFALTSIAAAVLGGASLTGGKGSYVGAVFGAVFLALITNILPLLGWSSAFGQIATGVLTLLALVLYRGGSIGAVLRDASTALRWRGRSAELERPIATRVAPTPADADVPDAVDR